jgi:mono/diheme cytochrome c family protein
MKKILVAIGISLLVLHLQVGCGSPRRGELYGGSTAIESPLAEKGAIVFADSCNQCHPGGTAGVGPALNNKPLPGFLIKFQVRYGLGAMPAFSEDEIGPEELNALVAYLKELRRAD